MFGENLMVIVHILKNIPVFFGVFFTMMYVLSDFIWITSKKENSEWMLGNNQFLHSSFESFHRMMSLSLFGNIAWLDVVYENDTMKIYYMVIWMSSDRRF